MKMEKKKKERFESVRNTALYHRKIIYIYAKLFNIITEIFPLKVN